MAHMGGEQCSIMVGKGVRPVPHERLRIGVMNVTSMRVHLPSIIGADVDIKCLQETRSTAQGQEALEAMVSEEGCSVVWGAPLKSRTGGIWRAPQGGVAILHKRQLMVRAVPMEGVPAAELWTPGRAQHVHLVLGDRNIIPNIINVCGP